MEFKDMNRGTILILGLFAFVLHMYLLPITFSFVFWLAKIWTK